MIAVRVIRHEQRLAEAVQLFEDPNQLCSLDISRKCLGHVAERAILSLLFSLLHHPVNHLNECQWSNTRRVRDHGSSNRNQLLTQGRDTLDVGHVERIDKLDRCAGLASLDVFDVKLEQSASSRVIGDSIDVSSDNHHSERVGGIGRRRGILREISIDDG